MISAWVWSDESDHLEPARDLTDTQPIGCGGIITSLAPLRIPGKTKKGAGTHNVIRAPFYTLFRKLDT